MEGSMAKILIVDDEEEIRRLLERLLEIEGYEVLVAAGGGTALELLGTAHPDVVVLDLKMPWIGGLTVLEQIRRVEPEQHVIVFTGAGTPETKAKVIALGVADYLEKDQSLYCVVESVKQLLETVPLSH
jgi:DNA-binding NtrC family response regulator